MMSALAVMAMLEFSSPACRIAFKHPAGWEVANAGQCSFTVRPKNLKQRLADYDVDMYTMSVDVNDESFEQGLPNSGFEQKDGKWVVAGRQGARSPAHRISGQGWSGVQGTAAVGCFHESADGGYAGLCDSPRAFVGQARRSALLEAGPQSEREFELILKSFRFLP